MRSYNANNRRSRGGNRGTNRRDPIVLRQIPYGYRFDEKRGYSKVRTSSGFKAFVVAASGVVLAVSVIVASIVVSIKA